MTPEFFRQTARKVGMQKALQENPVSAATIAGRWRIEELSFDQMTQYFTFAFEKLSPTQRLQVAKKISDFTET